MFFEKNRSQKQNHTVHDEQIRHNEWNNMSKEEKIAYLNRRIREELEKEPAPDEVTIMLLMEALYNLTPELRPSEDTVRAKLALVHSMAQDKQRNKPRPKSTGVHPARTRLWRVVVAIIICVCLFTMSAITISADILPNSWEDLINRYVVPLKPGDSASDGNVDIYISEAGATYDSMGDFLAHEEFPYLYPQNIPEEYAINYVYSGNSKHLAEDAKKISMTFHNCGVRYSVMNYNSYDFSEGSPALEDSIPFTVEGHTYYLLHFSDSQEYYAILQENGMEYLMSAPEEEYDILVMLLQHMKGES